MTWIFVFCQKHSNTTANQINGKANKHAVSPYISNSFIYLKQLCGLIQDSTQRKSKKNAKFLYWGLNILPFTVQQLYLTAKPPSKYEAVLCNIFMYLQQIWFNHSGLGPDRLQQQLPHLTTQGHYNKEKHGHHYFLYLCRAANSHTLSLHTLSSHTNYFTLFIKRLI